MKRTIKGLALGFLLSWAGCQAAYKDPMTYDDKELAGPIAVPPGEGVVTIGFSAGKEGFVAPINGYLVKIDPETGAHAATDVLRFNLADYDAGHNLKPGGGPVYLTYHLPAGTYALGAVAHGSGDHNHLFMISQFPSELRTQTAGGFVAHTLPHSGKALPGTPIFTVTAGKSEYIGDIALNVSDEKNLHWSFGRSDDQAKAVLARTGLVETLEINPMTRFDGTPLTQDNSVAASEGAGGARSDGALADVNGCGYLQRSGGACVRSDQTELLAFKELRGVQTDADHSILVLGVRFASVHDFIYWPVYAGFVAFDKDTGMRSNKDFILVNERCGKGMKAERVICQSAQYLIFKVPPGSYALGWATDAFGFAENRTNGLVSFSDLRPTLTFDETRIFTDVTMAEKVSVAPNSPIFSIGPDEVVYVGDLMIDVQNQTAQTTTPANQEAARAVLGRSPLAQRLAARPMEVYAGPAATK